MRKFPKYLVEMDREPSEDAPSTPLWTARLRDPFALGLFDVNTIFMDVSVSLWPPALDADLGRLRDRLADALFREYDLDPCYFSPPESGPIAEPPEFLWMVQPNTEREFILDPYAPRLWRFFENGVTCWRGFGKDPQFPRDIRRLAEFIREI